MEILEDMGITNLDGKVKCAKHYYKCKCNCGNILTVRQDNLNKEFCRRCKGSANNSRAIKIVKETTKSNKKKCSICKIFLPLINFGKKKQMLSGYRSSCKICRKNSEQEGNKSYRKTDKGKIISANCQAKRRDYKLNSNNNSITTKSLIELKLKQNNKCNYCKCELQNNIKNAVHLDHVIPLSKGGKHILENVVWSCQKCNLVKGSSMMDKQTDEDS